MDELLRTWECGRAYHLQVGSAWSCGEHARWCYDRLPGAFDRSFAALLRAPSPQLRSLYRPPNASQAALAVWHMRTGDITLPLRRDAAVTLKRTIDDAFPRRGVRHVLVTYKRAALVTTFPWMDDVGLTEVMDSAVLSDEKAFAFMLRAEVVVSTGSSFAHIPPGFAQAGRQIHFYLPPKNTVEMRGDVCCLLGADCICESSSPSSLPARGATGKASHRSSHTNPSSSRGGGRLAYLDDGPACSSNRTAAATKNESVRSPEKAEASFAYKMRTHPYWMGSFTTKNTVPVLCSGRIFPEYRYKLRELARGIDGETGAADESIAHLSYEGWL